MYIKYILLSSYYLYMIYQIHSHIYIYHSLLDLTWFPQKAEGETKASVKMIYMVIWFQGAGVRERKSQTEKGRKPPIWECITELGAPMGNWMLYPRGPSEKPCGIHLRTTHLEEERGKHLFIISSSQLVKDCPEGHRLAPTHSRCPGMST